MFLVTKRELNAFPFDKFYEYVFSAVSTGLSQVEEDARRLHDKAVDRKIEMIYSAREDSYEGDKEADFPFAGIDPELKSKESDRLRREASSLFLEKYEMKSNSSWLMPQFTAFIARLPISRNETGKYDPMTLYTELRKDNFHRGLLLLGTHHARGEIVQKQYTPESRNYSALVPLLLMPFKKFDNIKYSDWDTTNLQKVIDPTLWQALNTDFDISSIDKNELLRIREHGLKVKSGKSEGTTRSTLTSHKLYGVEAPYGKLHWLAQAMLFQIWCAHPSQRTELMILDWKDWDNVPEPLIQKDVIKSEPKTFTKSIVTDDWL